jgi:hypothetical protein
MALLRKKTELDEAAAKYPAISRFLILKQSMRLNGVVLAPASIAAVQNDTYSFGRQQNLSMESEIPDTGHDMPGSILLRDGTNVSVSFQEVFPDPYLVEWDGKNFLLMDGEEIVDEIDFVPRPQYFGVKTSRGIPMDEIASSRGQTLGFSVYRHCHLWDSGHQCRYCMFFTDVREIGDSSSKAKGGKCGVEPDDIYETVRCALREPGRFSIITLTGGMDYSGKEVFDNEVDRYIGALQAIGRNFRGRFASHLMAPAYSKKQLKRLYDNTGLTSYCPNIEVWDEKISKWICPGKNLWPGREEWIRRTLDAVEIFGENKVYTQVVAGVELAQPHGFKTVDEALESNFQACEFYAKHGVIFVATLWRPHTSSALGKQPAPPLEYYLRLAQGLYEIRGRYGLSGDMDDYKRCGNHVDTDMERLDVL